MSHNCRMGKCEIFEDESGYLYMKVINNHWFHTENIKIEFCPICGNKSNKSFKDLLRYGKEDFKQAIDQMNINIQSIKSWMSIQNNHCESFLDSVQFIVKRIDELEGKIQKIMENPLFRGI